MAYDYTTTYKYTKERGIRYVTLEVVETDVESGSEWVWGDEDLELMPGIGTIALYQTTLISGTGVNLSPELGKSAGWTSKTQNVILGIPAMLAKHYYIDGAARYAYPIDTTRPTLYGRSGPNDGTDNVVHTLIVILEGYSS